MSGRGERGLRKVLMRTKAFLFRRCLNISIMTSEAEIR